MNNRREFIMSAVLAGAAVPLAKGVAVDRPAVPANPLVYPMRPLKAETSRELTVAVMGAGGRGNVYQA